MYDKEIVDVIVMNHRYEYCIVNHNFQLLKYSEDLSKYCDEDSLDIGGLDLFDVSPELVGMEEDIERIFEEDLKELVIPLVFKVPDYYINIHIYKSKESNTLIVLFENITDITKSQQGAQQAHNENLLLLKEIENKNKQLETFNQEMQRLVDEEVAKNIEQQHMIELQTRHAQMGEMIAMITHQWKQPLSVIQSIGTLLQIKYERDTLTKTLFTDKMDNLLTQVSHMNQTVGDFQKFFMPSKEQDYFDIKETILSVLHLVQMEYTLQNVNIELIEDTEASVFGYANEYTQVILAILQNAKDALSSSSQADKQIIIRIQKNGEGALVTIDDNAGGIPEEIIEDIFTQYVTSKETGSGLGLYIAKMVIENNMQGQLWVTNTDVGAQFSILL